MLYCIALVNHQSEDAGEGGLQADTGDRLHEIIDSVTPINFKTSTTSLFNFPTQHLNISLTLGSANPARVRLACLP
jgi:hypothetical protein